MTQLSLKSGMKIWKLKERAQAKSDTEKLQFRDTFNKNHHKYINEDQKKSILESHMFLK